MADLVRGDRRSALVKAAFDVIARDGFEGLRLRAVAADAGIDHSSLHHHFATKQDLISAVVTFATDPLRSTIPHDGAPGERLRGHLATLAAMMRSQPDLFVVLAEIDLRARRDPAIAAAVKAVEDGWRQALTQLLTSVEVHGDPGVLTELVIATVKGIRLRPASAADVLDALATLLSPRTVTRRSGGGP
jgi:AcrR family transcriptional regulator